MDTPSDIATLCHLEMRASTRTSQYLESHLEQGWFVEAQPKLKQQVDVSCCSTSPKYSASARMQPLTQTTQRKRTVTCRKKRAGAPLRTIFAFYERTRASRDKQLQHGSSTPHAPSSALAVFAAHPLSCIFFVSVQATGAMGQGQSGANATPATGKVPSGPFVRAFYFPSHPQVGG
jgi:hypothetical protein